MRLSINLVDYRTPYGRGLLIWRDGLLVAHRLPGEAAGARPHGPAAGEPVNSGEMRLVADLEAYFAGRRVQFDALALPLDLRAYSRFELDIAAALAAVPYGRTTCYGELAAAAGHRRAQRATGSFMARNSFPLILPCHRVLRSSGHLGNFSAGRGWKERLLALEGVRLKDGALLETAAAKQ